MVIASSVLIAVGLSRRGAAWEMQASSARSAVRAVVASVAPRPHWNLDDLAIESQQSAQPGRMDLKPPPDAALGIAAVISGWPTQIPAKAQSITATGDSASVAVTVPGDPTAFVESFKLADGWMLNEPRFTSVERMTRMNLEFRRRSP
jgi:hypothetical protein